MDIMKMGRNPNYLGSWDVEDMPRREIMLTIKKIVDDDVVGNDGRAERNTIAYFAEDGYKPMILNITNKKTLCRLYKTKESEKLIGKRIKIGVDKVNAFGNSYDALRIRPEIPAASPEKLIKCDECGGDIEPFGKLGSAEIAAYTMKNYGRRLCSECATKEKEAANA